MTEIGASETPRILSEEQADDFSGELLKEVDNEKWKDAAYANISEVKLFFKNGIDMIQKFEQATHQKHPEVHSDTDVIYIDSGPGPYRHAMSMPQIFQDITVFVIPCNLPRFSAFHTQYMQFFSLSI